MTARDRLSGILLRYIQTAVSNPPANQQALYAGGDSYLYTKDSAGSARRLLDERDNGGSRVDVVAIGDYALTGLQTVDGVAGADGLRVLCVGQKATHGAQPANGAYIMHSGAWTRDPRFDTSARIAGSEIVVMQGTAYKGTRWRTNFSSVDTLDTTYQTWYALMVETGNAFQYPTPAGEGHLYWDINAQQLVAWDTAQGWIGLSGSQIGTAAYRAAIYWGLPSGTTFYEIDTGNHYVWASGQWNQTGGPTTTLPRMRAYISANQAIATSALWTKLVNWSLDTPSGQAAWATSGNGYVVPTSGFYTINAQVQYAFAAAGARCVRVLRNGVSISQSNFAAVPVSDGASATTHWQGDLVAGDVITIEVFQRSGASLAVLANKEYSSVDIAMEPSQSTVVSNGVVTPYGANNPPAAPVWGQRYYDTVMNVELLYRGAYWQPINTPQITVAATTNLTLSGLQTVDGIACADGYTVLAWSQTTPSQNGVYVVHSGAWTRAYGWEGYVFAGQKVRVINGSAWAYSEWTLSGSGTAGTDPQYFTCTGGDTGWIAPGSGGGLFQVPWANGWADYGSGWQTQYRRLNGTVYVQIMAKSGTVNTNFFVLPAGFRPNVHQPVKPMISAGAVSGTAYLVSGGAVYGTGTVGNAWQACSFEYPAAA